MRLADNWLIRVGASGRASRNEAGCIIRDQSAALGTASLRLVNWERSFSLLEVASGLRARSSFQASISAPITV